MFVGFWLYLYTCNQKYNVNRNILINNDQEIYFTSILHPKFLYCFFVTKILILMKQ